jgi:excisionase family DNA binding protein
MTVREVSAYLHVHTSTIYRMLKHHQIPAFRVGSDWRFNIESIDRRRLGPPVKALARQLRLVCESSL